MPTSFATVEQQATALLPEERARLAGILLESLDNESVIELATTWQQEIAQRVAGYAPGEAETFPAAQVCAEAIHITG